MWKSFLRAPKIFLTMSAIALTLAACDKSTSNETPSGGDGNALTGTVLDKGGKGIANVSVRLKSTGQTATTNQDGAWSIPVKAARTARSEATIDSVQFAKDSQYIASQPVPSYTAELPPLYIVQRDIFGNLSGPREGIKYTITAYLTLPDFSTKAVPLWHNAVGKSYSGFIYTLYAPKIETLSVRVEARNASAPSTNIAGISPTIPFSTQAGNIQIPTFGYENLTPSVTFSVDGRVEVGGKVQLNAIIGDTDLIAGVMASDTSRNTVEWKYGSKSAWVAGNKQISVIIDTALIRDSCISAKVKDDQGGVSEASYCFEFSKSPFLTILNPAVRRGWIYSGHIISFDSIADTVRTYYDHDGRPFLGPFTNSDTLDISLIDTATIDTNHANYLLPASALGIRKPLSSFIVDSLGVAGSKLTRMVVWSSKHAVISFFGDTVELQAGDNIIATSRAISDTSFINLRLLAYTPFFRTVSTSARTYPSHYTRISYLLDPQNFNKRYALQYASMISGKSAKGDLPLLQGVFANGLLQRDNSDANSGKFVIKSITGYR